MQPLLVRRAANGGDFYEIVAGERRWRAAQMAGAHELPVIVHELSDRDALEVALLENVQRQDLSPLEEAEGYRRLIEEFDHTQEALASALGKSRSHIANLLRLLGLPDGRQTDAGARRIVCRSCPGPARRPRSAGARPGGRQPRPQRPADGSPGAGRQRAAAAPPRTRPTARTRTPGHSSRSLSQKLGLTVCLTPKGGGGTLQIAYGSLEQLDALIARLS